MLFESRTTKVAALSEKRSKVTSEVGGIDKSSRSYQARHVSLGSHIQRCGNIGMMKWYSSLITRASYWGAVAQRTYLIGKSSSTKITERKLESSVAALDIDLQGNKSIGVGGGRRRHDCCCIRLLGRVSAVVEPKR